MSTREKTNSENTSTSQEEIIQYQEYQVGEKKIKLYNTNKAYRLPEETFEEYKLRQKFNKNMTNHKLKPKLWWDSKRWGTMTPESLKVITEAIEQSQLNKK